MTGSDIFELMHEGHPQEFRYGSKKEAFRNKYMNVDTNDVEWIDICDTARSIGCYAYAFYFLRELLNQRAYKGNYADELYAKLDTYNAIEAIRENLIKDLFCGDRIRQQIIYKRLYKSSKSTGCSIAFVNTENMFLVRILNDYLNNSTVYYATHGLCFTEAFGESLGEDEMKIASINDFNADTLLRQADYYKDITAPLGKNTLHGTSFIVNFYRWLVRSNLDHKFFDGSFKISEPLLFASRFPMYLEEGYYFTTLSPNNVPYGHDRICFIVRDRGNESTTITDDTFITVDLSSLECRFYRDLLLEYMVTSNSIHALRGGMMSSYARDAMQTLYEIKHLDGYKHRDLTNLTCTEAALIHDFLVNRPGTLATINNRIGAVRRFLSYCVDKGSIKVEDRFFRHLTQYEEPPVCGGETIPDNELVALSDYLLEKGRTSLKFKEAYIIYHLILQTEFRIGQICHLKTDCLQPTIKPDEYAIKSISKTSHGRKESNTISIMTYNMIRDIINETEQIRENCASDDLRQYIFLYDTGTSMGFKVFDSTTFREVLQKACDDLGLCRYSGNNLRDTHMTKAYEYICRNDKSDLEMSVLSKHRRMDTTNSHYIEEDFDGLLEATYGIVIGEADYNAEPNIVESIPDEFNDTNSDAENGCGKCTANHCVAECQLSCLMCKDFVTTVDHEVYFRNAIDDLDRRIAEATVPHDKEDLYTIKLLYFSYLKAILKHKEMIANGGEH